MQEKPKKRLASPQIALLDGIRSPRDLKRLTRAQLSDLAGEIRELLVDTVSQTGGHLASNLGVVELTIAMHRVFNSPVDRMIFDVGHQCYTHKILTGRRNRFSRLRQKGGLSGFPKRSESEHDAFLTGHSSTSISAAMGLARAKKLRGEPGKVIAVIGDGSFSGIAFEALNNIAPDLTNLVVILNDNEMSISKNVSPFARHLARIRNTRGYYRFKDGLERSMLRIPVLGGALRDGVSGLKSAAKNALYHSNLFEDMGFTYIGPVEGHSFEQLLATLTRAKALQEPVLVHVHTRKGKGYWQAEENPGAFHGVSKFDPAVPQKNELSADSFSEQAGQCLTAFGETDRRIVTVTAAMKYATGLHHFSTRFREEGRFFDVGIAESHAAIFASAMSVGGLLPVICVYSSFLQRSYDQLLHDCSLEATHVVIGVDRAGLVGEDGETHQGVFDVPFLTTLPGAVIYSPATYEELREDFRRALYEEKGLAAVRYPRGRQTFYFPEDTRREADYSWIPAKEKADCLAITYGRIVGNLLEALKQVDQKIDLAVMNRIFPLPAPLLQAAVRYRRIVFVEESSLEGGLGQRFAAALLCSGWKGEFILRAIENPVVPQGTLAECLEMVGLDPASLVEILEEP
ncbi:MAG: 1-deoxy-D-xylulose-5-phosphate synthase [Provencibacterium sp.]|jgi:1-deoxy-D-xylulose-5-phosphate synthase|nr:1-deoxy-D-xylulose-5-phosphate synthase [Provencibacterium sp.]